MTILAYNSAPSPTCHIYMTVLTTANGLISFGLIGLKTLKFDLKVIKK